MKFAAPLYLLLFASSATAQTATAGKVEMAVPGVKGNLTIDVGAVKPETRVRPDGKEVQLRALGRTDGLEISAFLQHVTFPASPEKCRDAWWPGTKNGVVLQRDDLQELPAKDGIARVEFIVPEFKGTKVRQKNVHAYLGGGELCAEIHLSKVSYKPSDQKLFDDLLSTAKLDPEVAASAQPAPDRDSAKLFAEGSKLFLQQDYAGAAIPYQKALDLEKEHPTLSRDYFRVLVDNLGMSYGISGKLAEAKATFEYGLTRDPEYPLFFYNLACDYGEMNSMDKAIDQLRLAYKYKANMIAGETFPDPLRDDSFRNFVDRPEFVKAVHEMQK